MTQAEWNEWEDYFKTHLKNKIDKVDDMSMRLNKEFGTATQKDQNEEFGTATQKDQNLLEDLLLLANIEKWCLRQHKKGLSEYLKEKTPDNYNEDVIRELAEKYFVHIFVFLQAYMKSKPQKKGAMQKSEEERLCKVEFSTAIDKFYKKQDAEELKRKLNPSPSLLKRFMKAVTSRINFVRDQTVNIAAEKPENGHNRVVEAAIFYFNAADNVCRESSKMLSNVKKRITPKTKKGLV